MERSQLSCFASSGDISSTHTFELCVYPGYHKLHGSLLSSFVPPPARSAGGARAPRDGQNSMRYMCRGREMSARRAVHVTHVSCRRKTVQEFQIP